MPELLIEIGTEEIPATYLEPATRSLGEGLARALLEARIAASGPSLLFTPRRLVVHFEAVAATGESRTERRTGPAARIAFDAEGKPSKAALGFARSAGVDPAKLEIVETEKGPYVTAVVTDEGEPTAAVLARALPGVLAGISFPKSMRWTGSPVPFARPIRNLVVLLGDEVIAAEAAGVTAGRATIGHPFLAPQRFDLATADLGAYREALRERRVLADPDERRAVILGGLASLLGRQPDAAATGSLLEEVVNLTEWPVVIEGRIDGEYLELPVEVLEVSMRVHLRFFPVLDAEGRPEARFLAVMNRDTGSADIVREGNERVLRARLTDARFFFGADRHHRLESFVPRLGDKALHRELGSYLDKTERVGALGVWLAEAARRPGAAAAVALAARLATADLATEMVGEFPELQGTMGRIYATLDGEPAEVARAIGEHYRPRGPDDGLPEGDASVLLALAEKLDDLAAFFSIGGAPTGSSDPFGLRRQALGLIRISFGRDVSFPVRAAVGRAIAPLGVQEPEKLAAEIVAYLGDRLYQSLTDEGFRYDLVRACLGAGFDDLPDRRRRLAALTTVAGEPVWAPLVEVVERTGNIIRGSDVASEIDPVLLTEDAERALHDTLARRSPVVRELLDRGAYAEAAREFVSSFGSVVHAFFAAVYVNVDDAAVRANRVALLGKVNELFAARVADLARVEKDAVG